MDRIGIYYWKCDRESAFHGTSDYLRDQTATADALRGVLARRYGSDSASLRPAAEGQGNHRTFRARLAGREVFIRTEDGPEGDDYLAVEAEVARRLSAAGVSVPETIDYDCDRREVPFAWQVMPFLPWKDLNSHVKSGSIDWTSVAPQIGRAIARWQEISAPGFGPFSSSCARRGELRALHESSEGYYRLNLERHLRILTEGSFLEDAIAARILRAIDARAAALRIGRGVLVHKDLAAWNILGTANEAKAFIDWDDCIVGDAMDDLSLMGVTGEDAATRQIVAAYAAERPLAPDAAVRFWLCWLRNILFKAVIRLGAGYFKKRGDDFFLIGGGGDGETLARLTREKIMRALTAVERGFDFDELDNDKETAA